MIYTEKPIVSFSSARNEKYDSLKTIIGNWHMHPTEILAEAKSVISYFIPFTKEVAISPKEAENGAYLWAEAYEVINKYFSTINDAVVDYLISQGFPTKSIIVTYDQDVLKAVWSHKSAAVISGLGSFGANRLVITEKGSAGRFGSIVTAAELEPSTTPAVDRCSYIRDGSCGLCFKTCPVQAFEQGGFEKFICRDELLKNDRILKTTSDFQHVDTCGKCISICPSSYMV